MYNRLLPGLFFLLLFHFAQSQDSLLTEITKKLTYQLRIQDGRLTGPGQEFLAQIGKESAFFLIGENHGMAEIPQFAHALFKDLKQNGYRYFAVETGPHTAEMIQEFAMQKDWHQAFQEHYGKYPWSVPFFSWQEECKILPDVLKGNNPKEALIWGLDQEFAASFRMFFNQLHQIAKNEASKQLALEYYQLAEKRFKEASETKNPGKSIMTAIGKEDFDKLKKVFHGQAKALDILQELDESLHIYKLWFSREGFKSNQLRAALMKRHFWQYYTEAKKKESQPKVLFKFGANHIYKGANGLNVFDIGNFVSEVANMEGTKSFHLYTVARKGTQNVYTPFSRSEDDKKKPHNASDYLDRINFMPFFNAVPDDQWAIIDLRPLKAKLFNRSLKKLQKGLEKLIWSYDAVLIIPEVHASTFFE